MPAPEKLPILQGICSSCGSAISSKAQHCHSCSLAESGKRLASAQELGRVAALSPASLKKHSEAMNLHKEALRNWKPSDLPDWLTDEVYAVRIQPALARLSKKAIELVRCPRRRIQQLREFSHHKWLRLLPRDKRGKFIWSFVTE